MERYLHDAMALIKQAIDDGGRDDRASGLKLRQAAELIAVELMKRGDRVHLRQLTDEVLACERISVARKQRSGKPERSKT